MELTPHQDWPLDRGTVDAGRRTDTAKDEGALPSAEQVYGELPMDPSLGVPVDVTNLRAG